MNRVILTPGYFPTPTIGRPIANGSIYVGIVDVDPIIPANQKQVSVQQENGSIIPVAQPISTGAGGVPLYNGSPVTLLVDGNYSLKVLDSAGALIYYVPSNASFSGVLQYLNNYTELRALTPTTPGEQVSLSGRSTSADGGGGLFYWEATDLSVQVSADPLSGLYVAPNSDLTGASGSWVRLYARLVPEFFGTGSAAFVAATARNIPVYLTNDAYSLSSVATVNANITGNGKTVITLTETGNLLVDSEHVHFEGFELDSSVNGVTFVRVTRSYFTFNNFRIRKGTPTFSATAQIGINFDTTANSIYFCSLSNFKFYVDYPVRITGTTTQAFNANSLGINTRDSWQGFLSALTIEGSLNFDANNIAGYFEEGTNVITHTAGSFRQNRIDAILDSGVGPAMTAYNTNIALTTVDDVNKWTILDPNGFKVVGPYPLRQILIGPPSSKVRATNSIADSIPNAVDTKLKYDAEIFDTLNEFSPGAGDFIAKDTGYYTVSARALSASATWPSGSRWEIRLYRNSIQYSSGTWNQSGVSETKQKDSALTTLIFLNAGDSLDTRIIHNQGGPLALDTTPASNYIEISRM